MTRQAIDWHALPLGSDDVHRRLLKWALWVRPSHGGRRVNPMFASVMSSGVWIGPVGRDELLPLECQEVEQHVSRLEPGPREAVRWYYVHRTSPLRQAKAMDVTQQRLRELIDVGVMALARTLS